MSQPFKTKPPYAVASVDHALRLATILQLEGGLSVSQAAERLGVARSTAHRALAMLVYRDFAVQDDDRVYRAGPVLELAAHSPSATALLRRVALPHLQRLVDEIGESANVSVRTGTMARFVASAESPHVLRVGSREGMVFPAHQTTAGMILLAALSDDEIETLYTDELPNAEVAHERPDLGGLRAELRSVRRAGHAFNNGRSERGVVAVGVPVRRLSGEAIAGLSISLPSVRFEPRRLPQLVARLLRVARDLEADLEDEIGIVDERQERGK